MTQTKVAVVEDHSMFRSCFTSYLNTSSRVNVIFAVENGLQLFKKLQEQKPDIIFMDYRLPGKDGLTLTREIHSKYENIRIIMISSYDSEAHILNAISQGVSGYISKFEDVEHVFDAIEKVVSLGFYFSDKVTRCMVEKFRNRNNFESKSQNPAISVNKIELQILQLMSEELTSKEIALKLNKSVRSIDGHKRKLMNTSGTTNACGLIMFGIRNGLIPIDPVDKN